MPASPPVSIAFFILACVPDGASMLGPTPGRKTSLSIHSAMTRARIDAMRATMWSRPIHDSTVSRPRPIAKYVTQTAPTYRAPADSSRFRAASVGIPAAVTELASVSV